MQSTYLSRSFFGCTRISFIGAALFFGTLVFAGNAGAQEPASPPRRLPRYRPLNIGPRPMPTAS